MNAVCTTIVIMICLHKVVGGADMNNFKQLRMHAAIGPFNKSDYVRSLTKVGAKSAFPDMKFKVHSSCLLLRWCLCG